MKNRKMILQALACLVLILSLTLPSSFTEAASVATHVPDDRPVDAALVDDSGDISRITLNSPEGQVIPLVAAGGYQTVELESGSSVVAARLEVELTKWDLRAIASPDIWQQIWAYDTDLNPKCVSVSPNGNYVAVGGSRKVYFLDGTGGLLWNYPTEYPIVDISMTADVSQIVAAGCAGYFNGGALYFLTRQGELLGSINPVVSSVSTSPEGKYLAITYDHGLGWLDRVSLWGYDEGEWLWYKNIGDSETGAVALSANGEYLAAGAARDVFGDGGKLQLYNKAGQLLWEYQIDMATLGGGKYAVSMSADGKFIAAGNRGNDYLYLFDRDQGFAWSHDTGAVRGVSVSADGTHIVAAANEVLYLFDNHMNLLWSLSIDNLEDVAISGDATMIVAVTNDNRVYAFSSLPIGIPKFLTLPFTDSGIKIQQGWRYTAPIGPNPTDPYAHNGIDYIKGIMNQPATWQPFDLAAAADGVAMHSSGGGYGDFVLIRHNQTDPEGRNYFTLYGHLGDIEDSITYRADRFATDYENWTPVTRGEKIGMAGSTGVSDPTWVHLHFEVQRGSYAQNKVDPYDIYSTRHYYPGGGMYTECGVNSLWLEGVCPPYKPSGDSAKFVADVTVPDGTSVQQGEEFIKTWRLRNIGTTTWTTDYKLVFDGGDLMGAPQYVSLDTTVPPNEAVDISVPMTAPTSGGAKKGYWRMENSSGLRFGHTVWVEIFVPYTPNPDLQEAIDNLYDTTMQRLEMLKTNMQTAAEHGDFFREQVTAEQAALAVTLVSGFVSMGADILNSIEHAKYVFTLTHPGMDIASGGWWHELQSYDVGKYLFSGQQWQHLLATSPQAFNQEILSNNWMSYAAIAKGIVRDELAKHEALDILKDIAGWEDCLSEIFYPCLVSAIDMAEQHLIDVREELLTSLPSLSPEEQIAYAADLNSRAKAARNLYISSTHTVSTLSEIRSFYGEDWITRIGLALAKLFVRGLATAAFDGPGKLLVDGFLTAFDGYVHKFKMEESQRMVALAEGLLERGIGTSNQLHLNAFSGLSCMEDGMAPQVVTGHIESISHYSEGYDPWGFWSDWDETGSYSVIRVTNDSTDTEPATFHIVASYSGDYEALFGIDTCISEATESGIVEVSPGETVDVRLNYKDGTSGSSPAKDTYIFIYVLGSNDSGTFWIDTQSTNWNPQLVSQATGKVMHASAATQNDEEIEITENPVYVFLSALPEDLTYEVQTWVVNPVAQNVTATIVQDLSEDWEVLSAPDAQSTNSTHLVWELDLEEGGLSQVSFTFAYHGDLSLDIVVPGPIVTLETPEGEPLGELIGNSPSLEPILPVTGSVTMPVEVMPGEQAAVSVDLLNLSEDTADGDIIVSVTDPNGSCAYNETQAFSLAPSTNTTLDYLLPAFSEKGLYQVLTEISYGEVTRVMWRDVMRVGTMALEVSLNATPQDRVYPGDTITYTMSLNNTSAFTLNGVTAEATVPDGTLAHNISDDGQLEEQTVEWQLLDPLPSGEMIELSFKATVMPHAVEPGEAIAIKSSAMADSDEAFPVGSNEVRILLVANPAPVMGTIVGDVDLYGQMDNSGVLVTVNETYITTTESNGSFAIDVPGGTYNVTFTYPGFYSSAYENVTAVPGEELSLPSVVLMPIEIIEIQLSLNAGWNMVSVPLTLADNSTDVVFPGVAGIFTWDATSRSYYEPAMIDPEKGYWVAVIENTMISINGTPVDTWTTDIRAGWNMIGSVNTTVSIADPNDDPDGSVIPPAYWWDPVGKSYIITTDIEPGKGYWVASINDCTMIL